MNEVCDRFEAAWRATPDGAPGPRIEDYLADAVGMEPAVLVRHLVLLEIDYRRLRRERASASEYGSRFPSLANLLINPRLPANPGRLLLCHRLAPWNWPPIRFRRSPVATVPQRRTVRNAGRDADGSRRLSRARI